MADLARRATRWVGTLSDGNVHVKFHDDRLRNGGDITYWNFMETRFGDLRTLTFDLKFWKYLSVTEYPYSMCMLSLMMIGWEMTEILHFEILRKHGQTHTQTNKQTDMGITIPRPPPMGGEVINVMARLKHKSISVLCCRMSTCAKCDKYTTFILVQTNFDDDWGSFDTEPNSRNCHILLFTNGFKHFY